MAIVGGADLFVDNLQKVGGIVGSPYGTKYEVTERELIKSLGGAEPLELVGTSVIAGGSERSASTVSKKLLRLFVRDRLQSKVPTIASRSTRTSTDARVTRKKKGGSTYEIAFDGAEESDDSKEWDGGYSTDESSGSSEGSGEYYFGSENEQIEEKEGDGEDISITGSFHQGEFEPEFNIELGMGEIAVELTELSQSVEEVTRPAEEVMQPVKEVTQPVEEVAQPVEEETQPAEKVTTSLYEEFEPIEEPAPMPVEELVPVEEPLTKEEVTKEQIPEIETSSTEITFEPEQPEETVLEVLPTIEVATEEVIPELVSMPTEISSAPQVPVSAFTEVLSAPEEVVTEEQKVEITPEILQTPEEVAAEAEKVEITPEILRAPEEQKKEVVPKSLTEIVFEGEGVGSANIEDNVL